MKDLKDKAIQIKGKDYVLVADRVLFFNEEYKNGMIECQLLSELNADIVVMRARVTPDADKPNRYFSGYSQAKWGEGFINKTSALENCETSAVGRALGMMGIGVIDSIASVDEINKANNISAATNKTKPVNKVQPEGDWYIDKTDKAVNDITFTWNDRLWKEKNLQITGWYPQKDMRVSRENPDGAPVLKTDEEMIEYIKDNGSNDDQAQLIINVPNQVSFIDSSDLPF